jgi:WXXGXW repeat (2 copies)
MKIANWFRNTFLIAVLLAVPGVTFAQIGISITIAPPVLPVYVQPVCPAPNYIWTPGYWAWGDGGYYWVPGTWVLAPDPGLLWTPGYWGWGDGVYLWNAGYWGPVVGFYGGVDYGFGYGGTGFYGGRWVGGTFSYNTAVVNVNRTIIHNTYVDRTAIVNSGSRVSFNGGRGGIQMRPTAAQMTAEHEKRFGPIAAQTNQANFARADRANYASVNHGLPPHAAMQRPATSVADIERAAPARGARPATAARPEARSAARPAARPTPSARTEARPAARPEARPAAPSRPEARPAAPARSEARPESRPAPRPESRPAAPARPAARPESHPAARPETHAAPAKPEAKPEEKPHGR